MAASFAIRHARIFDGNCVLPYDTVLVRDGVIAAVGKDAAIPDADETIDGTGHTLLPGLIDAHTHVMGSAEALRLALLFGVTTELDMCIVRPARVAELKREQAYGEGNRLADLRSAGVGATAPGVMALNTASRSQPSPRPRKRAPSWKRGSWKVRTTSRSSRRAIARIWKRGVEVERVAYGGETGATAILGTENMSG